MTLSGVEWVRAPSKVEGLTLAATGPLAHTRGYEKMFTLAATRSYWRAL